ncbi:MAG: hypothetical protein GX573_21740 [Chloroflexi bacterium]|nr:hypothetical protein [Chloroflexota bacterium]
MHQRLQVGAQEVQQIDPVQPACEAHGHLTRYVGLQGEAISMLIEMQIPIYKRAEEHDPRARGPMSLLAIAAGGGTVPMILFLIIYLVLKKEGVL